MSEAEFELGNFDSRALAFKHHPRNIFTALLVSTQLFEQIEISIGSLKIAQELQILLHF